MGRKSRMRAARRAAMRSHPAGTGRNGDLEFGLDAVPASERMGREAWSELVKFDMRAINRKQVVHPEGGAA